MTVCFFFIAIIFALLAFRGKSSNMAPNAESYLSHVQLFQTGTTIVGLCCKDGVVLGADTRSTGGNLIINRHTKKIHQISDLIYCCGAGTAGDCEKVKLLATRAVQLDRVDRSLTGDYGRFDPLSVVLKSITQSIHKYKKNTYRRPEAVFFLGGVDSAGPSLYQINSKGSAQRVSYGSLGSGSYNAMAVLESALGNRGEEACNIPLEEGVDIVRRAVLSGIANDLGSGSHVDLCVVGCEGPSRLWRETSDRSNVASDERANKPKLGGSKPSRSSLGRLVSFARRDMSSCSEQLHGIRCKRIADSDANLQCNINFIV